MTHDILWPCNLAIDSDDTVRSIETVDRELGRRYQVLDGKGWSSVFAFYWEYGFAGGFLSFSTN